MQIIRLKTSIVTEQLERCGVKEMSEGISTLWRFKIHFFLVDLDKVVPSGLVY